MAEVGLDDQNEINCPQISRMRFYRELRVLLWGPIPFTRTSCDLVVRNVILGIFKDVDLNQIGCLIKQAQAVLAEMAQV